jgi:NADH-quinone oxidoreductase subunit L
MKAPLVALAIPSLLIGGLTIGTVLYGGFFGGAIQVLPEHDVVAKVGEEFHGPLAFALHGLTTPPFWLAAFGVLSAWYLFLKRPDVATSIGSRLTFLTKILDHKYYFDWFNENVLARASRMLGTGLWKGGDQGVIDGIFVDGSAHTVGRLAGVMRLLQSGYLYSYAFWMIIGLVGLLGWLLLKH